MPRTVGPVLAEMPRTVGQVLADTFKIVGLVIAVAYFEAVGAAGPAASPSLNNMAETMRASVMA